MRRDQNPEPLVVAMSGGVDSSVAALMLAEAGHSLIGLFMRNGIEVPEAEVPARSCCSLNDARDARMVADHLGIPFQAVDLGTEFRHLIEHFVAEYGRGRTPNPCLICNRDLKFHRLLDLADELGAEGVATGHYTDNINARAAGFRDTVSGSKGIERLAGEGGWTEIAGCPLFTNDQIDKIDQLE